MDWIKSFGKNLMAIGFGVVIAMGLLEVVLRIHVNTPILHTIGYLPRPKQNLFSLMPNQKGIWASDCYYIDPVKTNSIGYRDIEVTGKPVIAILGDSYMGNSWDILITMSLVII